MFKLQETKMCGRQWLASQGNDTINQSAAKVKAIKNSCCQRCGQLVKYSLPDGEKYCRECIGLGRICERDYLLRSKSVGSFPEITNGGLTWKGKLTPAQADVADSLVASFLQRKDHLVHAVTGAGKTEMLFKVVAKCLEIGKRVAIATPRIDVVDELYPRFCNAFEQVKIGKYHGREYHEPDNEQFIICTTHQLLKFYRAFDLLIIDEVDSFPYHENPVLYFGAQQAVKDNGSRFYLTATPAEALLKKAQQKQIDYSLLNRRFHGHLLPVPIDQHYLRPFLQKNRIHPKLLLEIKKIINSKQPLLIFVPRIAELPVYLAALKNQLPELRLESVYAGDQKRQEKVLAFRNQEIDVLLTTTILERGVTFPHVQVIVISADDAIYNTPSLVQIAGRVGRSKDDPNGKILFCYHRYTKCIRDAQRQIRMMNR